MAMGENSVISRTLQARMSVVPQRFRTDVPVVPVVRLTGVIGFSTPLKAGLTLATCARSLDRAFAYRKASAVALLINSPGGSAVEWHLIFQRSRALSRETHGPGHAFAR